MEIGSSKRRSVRPRSKWKPILTIILILIAIRLLLPFGMQAYFNARLDQLNGYTGRVDSVNVSLLRGAYTLNEVEILSRDLEIPSPFFTAERLEYAVQWSDFLRGNRVGGVLMHLPEVHIAVSPDGQWQTGAGVDWGETLSGLFPLSLNEVEVYGGTLHFFDFTHEEPVHVFVSDVRAGLHNLRNSRDLEEKRFASVRARGRPMGIGRVSLNIVYSPLADQPAFDLSAAVSGIELETLDPFLRTYGNYQVQAGTVDLYGEVDAAAGAYEGEVTAFFTGLTAQIWREPEPVAVDPVEEDEPEEPEEWPLWQLWEDIREPILELHGEPDALVLRAPFSKAFDDPAEDVQAAILQVLMELFVHGLVPGLELTVEED